MYVGKRKVLVIILEKISVLRGEVRNAGKKRLVEQEKFKPWGSSAEARYNWTCQEIVRAKAELAVLWGGRGSFSASCCFS